MSKPYPTPLEASPLAEDLIEELAHLRRVTPNVDPTSATLLESALFDPAHDILARSGKGFRARLLEHSWALAGGRPGGLPRLLPAAIELLHAGSLVIDDIEDDSQERRGHPTLHRRYGLPVALNTGSWLYFASMSCLSRIPCDEACRLALTQDVIISIMRCHEGQALDISAVVTSLPRADVTAVVSATTDLKTGTLMGLAAAMGARCAGAAEETVERIRAFGSAVGFGLQMLDDWSGIHSEDRRHKGLEDLHLRRPTWPWAWLAEHADQLSYADLVHRLRSASIDWELERVRDRLKSGLKPLAPGLIDTQLERAMSLLRFDGLDPAAADAAASELEALVGAYG
jgi:geranylgeranyl pyrophosphate synthase